MTIGQDKDRDYKIEQETAKLTTIEYIKNITDYADLKDLYALLKLKSSQLQQQAVFKFNIGDKVYFVNKKRGKVWGTITKINQKTINVTERDNPLNRWKVTANLLNKGEEL